MPGSIMLPVVLKIRVGKCIDLPEEGLEPTHLAVPDPKSGASANSAIRAGMAKCR